MVGTIKLFLFLAAVPVVSVDSLNEPFKWTRQKFAHPLIFVSNSYTKGDAARNVIQKEHFLKYHSYKRRAEFLHHVLFRRGGESVDENDIAADEEEIPMSHFMSSFESELAEIRREAELEAEKEMQKLRGMLEGSEDIYYDEEVDDEKVMREAYMDRKNEDDLDDEEVDGEGEHQLDELCSNDAVVYRDDSREENERGMEEQEGGNDEEAYDLDASSESTESLRKDNQTMEIEETAREEDRGEMIELDDVEGPFSMISEEQVEEISAAGEEMTGKVDYDSETKRTAIIENEIIEIEEKNSSEHPIPSTLDVMTTTEAKPKSSKKRKVGKMTNTAGNIITTSKKPKTKKGKAKAKKARLDEVVDIGSITDIHDFSSGGTIRKMGTQQSVEETLNQRNGELESSRSRSMTSLIRSDLVRALTLFIATVVVSVWMQRVQRQLEAQGN